MALPIRIIAILGFLLSFYAEYIDYKVSKSKKYKAVCDLNEKMACSKVVSGEYSKTFGISNSLLGMFFYALIFILTLTEYFNYVLYLAVFSVLGSVYLAYLQYFKIKNLCLVCTSVYIVNILLLIFSYLKVY